MGYFVGFYSNLREVVGSQGMEDVAALQTTAGGVLETSRLSPTEAVKQWLLFNGFFWVSLFFFGNIEQNMGF